MQPISHIKTEEDIISNVSGMAIDSRDVQQGYLFAALPGNKLNGRDFIPQAIENGASVILTDTPVNNIPDHVTVILRENPRREFARILGQFYDHQPETIVAVTGSNGKSSTVNFCRQIWQKMDYASASMGTIGLEADGIETKAMLTTPDPVTLHQEIQELEASGIDHLAMEASSHGLDQYRLDGVKLKAAGFTNLSRDHLDYHGDMGSYLKAKARLFSDLLPAGGTAVLNADIPEFDFLKSLCIERDVIDYGYNAKSIRIIKRDILPDGQDLKLEVFGEKINVHLPLVGEFQAFNALCALGLVIGSHQGTALRPFEAVTYLENLKGVRGRMEYIGASKTGGHVYVDYAHTPDGLKNVLSSLRPHTTNKLHVVFGCGGDRDTGKRPEMGKIATELADTIIVTDDNPRTEDPAPIRDAIMAACPSAENIGDRQQAIHHAIEGLNEGDILVIAGKGHETYQILNTGTIPFDDADIARKKLKS